MSLINISLAESLEEFMNTRVSWWDYDPIKECARELIHKNQDRQQLRDLLLTGAQSAPTTPADVTYFDALRQHISNKKFK